MARKSRIALIFLCLLSACASHRSHDAYDNAPLVWKPTSSEYIDDINMADLSGISFTVKKFNDVRLDKRTVGRNTEDEKAKFVSTSDDVGSWCTEHFADLLVKQGIPVSDHGSVTIQGDVVDFHVNETHVYKARVTIKLKATAPNGAVLWEGTLDGTQTRFGRSFHLDNYYETLSDALISGMGDLLTDASFVRSIKSEPVAATSAEQGAENGGKPAKKRKSRYSGAASR